MLLRVATAGTPRPGIVPSAAAQGPQVGDPRRAADANQCNATTRASVSRTTGPWSGASASGPLAAVLARSGPDLASPTRGLRRLP